MTDKLNEILYNKHFLERNSYNHKISKKDRKFYRKRILNLTRELFLSSDACNPDINEAFMNYLYHCVEHFKNTDTNDILQCEYADLNGDIDGDVDAAMDDAIDADDENDNMNTYNSSIMRKIVKPNTLDNFIIRNVIKKKEPEHLPLQKEINLKDPQLKVKGIVKKKNLINTYEDQENTDEKQENTDEKQENTDEKQENISFDTEITQDTKNTSNA
jgi:hypothetical protein